MYIISTHNHCDFDGFASMVAISKKFWDSRILILSTVEDNLAKFLEYHQTEFHYTHSDEISVHADEDLELVLVDTSNYSSLNDLSFAFKKISIFDHHISNQQLNDDKIDFILNKKAGACISIVLEYLLDQGFDLKKEFSYSEVLLFLLALYDDTGEMKYPTTTDLDIRIEKILLSLYKINPEDIKNFLRIPLNKTQYFFYYKMLENQQIYKIGDVKIAFVSVNLKFNPGTFGPVVNEYQRNTDAMVMFFFIKRNSKTYIMARSKLCDISVLDTMKILGGGGHETASAFAVYDENLDDTCERVKNIFFREYVLNARIGLFFRGNFGSTSFAMTKSSLPLSQEGDTEGVPRQATRSLSGAEGYGSGCNVGGLRLRSATEMDSRIRGNDGRKEGEGNDGNEVKDGDEGFAIGHGDRIDCRETPSNSLLERGRTRNKMEMETESDKEFRVEKIEVASNCLMKDFFTFLSFPQLSPPQLSPPSFQEGVRGSFSVRDFLIRDEHGTLVKIVNYDDVLKCLVAMEIFDETFGLNFTLKNDFFKNKIEYFDNFDNLEKYKKNNDLLDIKNVKILNVINVLIRIIVLAEKEDIKLFLVGGQVRDLLLDISDFENDEKLEAVRFLKKIIENERDFDLVVFCNNSSKDAIYFANALKNNFNLNKNQFKAETKSEILIKTNEQFKTVNVVLKSIEHDFEFSFDIATARDEKYAFSGALPEVSKAENLVSDIRRRDITINSMLLSLNRLDFGRIFDFYQGGRDLRDKKIRVNYPTSFIDDPTRIFRVIRFAVRLGFEIEENTRELLVQASEQLLVNKISKDRILNEIKKNFSEKDVIGNIRMMQEYGFLNAISEKIGSLLPLSQEGDTEGVSRRAIDVIDGFVVEGERICRETPSSSLLERGRTREEGKREIVKDDFNGLKLDTWFVWFLAVVKDLDFCERERIVREFGFFKSKKNALLENLEFLKTGEYKKLENMDDAEVYFCLKDGNFSFEFLVFCAFSVEANNENETIKNEKMEKIKNKILKYLNETRKIRLEIDGEYLKELGLVEGKQIGEILRKILGLKILKKNNENGVFGIEEEKKYALEFVKKLKS